MAPLARSAPPALVALAVALAACGAAERPCATAGACSPGQACVVGLCRAPDAAPSSPDATRFVLAPVDVAVIASHARGDARPEAVAFGRAANGAVELLLRFEAPWRDGAEVTSAFVVLDPMEGAPAAATPAHVDAARILEPWASDTVTWGRQPRLGPFDGEALLRPAGLVPARVDVTKLVARWSRRAKDDHGIALVATGDDAFGTVFALGATGGRGPRLEAYVK